jgi:glycosyltransferase involved in cell wall biosynthesis
MRNRLETAAPPNVEFLGRVDDAELADLYARCRALIYPQEEDFGIVAVEAQAAGRPVIAFGRGGARDTVVPVNAPGISANREPTGIWFTPQTSKALAEAVVYFEENESALSSEAIREWAKRFGRDRFRRELGDQIRNAVDGSRQAPPARSPNDQSQRD